MVKFFYNVFTCKTLTKNVLFALKSLESFVFFVAFFYRNFHVKSCKNVLFYRTKLNRVKTPVCFFPGPLSLSFSCLFTLNMTSWSPSQI